MTIQVPAHFAYCEVMSCGGGVVGCAIALLASLGYALLAPLFLLPPVRWLIAKLVPLGSKAKVPQPFQAVPQNGSRASLR